MDTNLKVILQQLEAEKSVNRETLIEAIRSAIESAARKSMTHAAEIMVDVDEERLEFKVFEVRSVVENVEEKESEIALADALVLNDQVKVGDRLKVPTEPKNFGRIAAQTAKQVIIQKIKDAERENIYQLFKKREGEVVTGIVKRTSHGNVYVMVDKAEAVVPPREQSPREMFKPGDRIRAYLILVEKSLKGSQVILSRSSPELVRSLFDMEVPEIYDGTIEIKALSREAGSRTKVAVRSNDPHVDAVGACVGMKGSRVRSVVEELSGEKIDIVRWSDDPVELCTNALNPADILNITPDEETNTLLVIVPHDQLSLAIGKKGQNARLTSKLVGWNIDIRSDVEISGETPPEAEEKIPSETAGKAAAQESVDDKPAIAEASVPTAEAPTHEAAEATNDTTAKD